MTDEAALNLRSSIQIFGEIVEGLKQRIASSPEGDERQSLERELTEFEGYVADLKRKLNLFELDSNP